MLELKWTFFLQLYFYFNTKLRLINKVSQTDASWARFSSTSFGSLNLALIFFAVRKKFLAFRMKHKRKIRKDWSNRWWKYKHRHLFVPPVGISLSYNRFSAMIIFANELTLAGELRQRLGCNRHSGIEFRCFAVRCCVFGPRFSCWLDCCRFKTNTWCRQRQWMNLLIRFGGVELFPRKSTGNQMQRAWTILLLTRRSFSRLSCEVPHKQGQWDPPVYLHWPQPEVHWWKPVVRSTE